MNLADLLAHLKRHGAYPLPEEGVEPSPLVELVETRLGPVAVLTKEGRRLLGARGVFLSQEALEALALASYLEDALRERGIGASVRWSRRRIHLHHLGKGFTLKIGRAGDRLLVSWNRKKAVPLEPGSYQHLVEVAYAHLSRQPQD